VGLRRWRMGRGEFFVARMERSGMRGQTSR
jgi:hypothetical protein